mgnify:CR=1 FL=1|tara:strand:- start:333 stop:947 length:615 start_codon:yes stop_codon:yes gene_type:complete
MTNIAIFGLGRSGTNSYAETLSLTSHQEHVYLKEYFSDSWALSDSNEIVPAEHGSLDFDKKYKYITSLKQPWLFNCTPYSVEELVLDLIVNHANVHLIIRNDLQEVFLSHILAWFGNSFYGNRVIRESNSIWINEPMFEKYRTYYTKYLDIVNKLSPAKVIKFEDVKFISREYQSQYNLVNKMDYIKNKQEVLNFLEDLQVSKH